MYMRFMVPFSVVSLIVAAVFAHSAVMQIAVGFVVCATAILIFLRAFEAEQYIWMLVMLAMVLLFNPILPLRFSLRVLLLVYGGAIAVLALSRVFVKAPALLTVESVVDPEPRRESL